jgi:hypothetical protein
VLRPVHGKLQTDVDEEPAEPLAPSRQPRRAQPRPAAGRPDVSTRGRATSQVVLSLSSKCESVLGVHEKTCREKEAWPSGKAGVVTAVADGPRPSTKPSPLGHARWVSSADEGQKG